MVEDFIDVELLVDVRLQYVVDEVFVFIGQVFGVWEVYMMFFLDMQYFFDVGVVVGYGVVDYDVEDYIQVLDVVYFGLVGDVLQYFGGCICC